MKLGKQPFRSDHRDLKFTDFADVDALLPKAPSTFGHELGITNWGMLGNDKYGDCTCAGAGHEHMDVNHAVGKTVTFTDADALALYTAVTGFNPNDPSTDQGAQVRDVLSYRRKHGIKDASGKVHKIDGFVSIEPGNLAHVLCAAYVFGIVGLGIMFPDYAMDQFNAGKPWAYESGKPAPTEGHYIPLVARRSSDLEIVTWAKEQKMTTGFFDHYADECWGIYSKEYLTAKGQTPDGFDQAKLDSVLAAL